MRSLHLAGRPDIGKRALGLAMAEPDIMLAPVTIDGQVQPFRQRVDNRHADTVKAARHLVGVIVELSSGMKLGHDDLGCRHPFLGVDLNRNAAPVVGH